MQIIDILNEAEKITGGHYELIDEPGGDISYSDGVFVIGVGRDKTLRASGLAISDEKQVRLIAGGLKMVLEEAKKQEPVNVLSRLIFEENASVSEIYRAAEQCGISNVDRYVFLMEFEAGEEDDTDYELLKEAFVNAGQDLFFRIDFNHLLIAHAAGEDFDPKEYALMMSESVMSEAMVKVRVAYSGRKSSLPDLRTGYREACTAFKTALLGGVMPDVISYEILGMERIVSRADEATCRLFLRELYGRESLPDIDESMKVLAAEFLDNDLEISETARKLYMHRNTFIYQLDKFQKQTGLNLRNFKDAMAYRMSLMIARRLNQLEEEDSARRYMK
ncbi:MAG: helix-turn-helix domain-containing protein [Lachnospiraceae bacterium]|nr:helix-turn-helix domain-containing protein [Lachnospiraceae bacterium]